MIMFHTNDFSRFAFTGSLPLNSCPIWVFVTFCFGLVLFELNMLCRFVVQMICLLPLFSLWYLRLLSLTSKHTSLTIVCAILGEPRHSAQPEWETGSGAWSPPLLPPPLSVVETDFPEGRRGRLRWWICSAEACLSDPAAWQTWLAAGVVQGTGREVHNSELCLCF